VTSLLLFLLGAGLLVLGADLLVRGGARLATAAGVSPLVVGLTVVAYGTSAPEMAVSVGSAFAGQADIAFGNAVGSNIFNILMILGASALVAPLVVAGQLVRVDVPLMIGACALVPVLGFDGRIGRFDGLLLFAGLVAYTVFSIRLSRRERAGEDARAAASSGDAARKVVASSLLLVIAGLLLLVLGARWLVDAAVAFAQAFGVSELIIGLTIVAAGTSLPEGATSIVAALRGERDIAVGNVVGSSIFNVLAVLGLAGLVAPAGVAVSPVALRFDVPVMIAAAVACLPIFARGHLIGRWEGALFLGYYAAYTRYLILSADRSPALPLFTWAMAGFVLPLTALTLAVMAWRAFVRSRGA
jgi:cation:H+ antiporter